MKLVMDEKLKHRLIGLAVIISLAAIFAPAIMKKSSQNMDGNFSVNVKLPPKPIIPNVVTTDEQEMFKTIKVAKVEIPAVSEKNHLPELAKAEPIRPAHKDTGTIALAKAAQDKGVKTIQSISSTKLALNESAKTTAKKAIKVAVAKPVKPAPVIATKAKVIPKVATVVAKANVKPALKQDIYALQLASFSQLSNAQSLVNKLKAKGYKANYIRSSGRNGAVYKVYVGHSPRKLDVMKLKTQLSNSMQLNGFVVNTGVS